jgi:hypothetical protein
MLAPSRLAILSLPGLTRQSIARFNEYPRRMDARVKPGHDEK